jgi:hypothetical protein
MRLIGKPTVSFLILGGLVGGSLVVSNCGNGDQFTSDSGLEDATVDVSGDVVGDVSADSPKMDAAKDSAADSGSDASSNDASDSGSDASNDASDGGTDASDAATDSPVSCTLGLGYFKIDAGFCAEGTKYSCGTDHYQIECDCPSGTCTCEKDDASVGSTSYTACPGCSSNPNFMSIAGSCGIPF